MIPRLLQWFRQYSRPLPWRKPPQDPYKVWVSEVMLQQTQVETVIPYFQRFIRYLPDLRSLAEASEEKVLKLWEGLGYYRRAHHLHEAAKIILKRWGGGFPQTYGEWLALPGIGDYTASMITSLCFGEKKLAVDGNVRRLASRLFLLENPTKKCIKEAFSPFMTNHPVGEVNEALMELGQTTCRKAQPHCPACPLKINCRALKEDKIHAYPPPRERARPPLRVGYVGIYLKDDKVFLQKRKGAFLKGLWGFPMIEEEPPGERLPPITHHYTHFSIQAHPVMVKEEGEPYGEGCWIPLKDLKAYPLSRLDQKVLKVLNLQSQHKPQCHHHNNPEDEQGNR